MLYTLIQVYFIIGIILVRAGRNTEFARANIGSLQLETNNHYISLNNGPLFNGSVTPSSSVGGMPS
jgi:hypothetical protein